MDLGSYNNPMVKIWPVNEPGYLRHRIFFVSSKRRKVKYILMMACRALQKSDRLSDLKF